MALRAGPLAFDVAPRTTPSSLGIRRAALWGLLLSKLIAGWGVQWDIQWHVLAYTIARKNGTPPGRTGGALHVFALLPAAIMAALDPRRRPLAASLGYAVTLLAVLGFVLGHRPAMAPMAPGAVETAIALGLTLAAGLIGGAAAAWLSDRLLRS